MLKHTRPPKQQAIYTPILFHIMCVYIIWLDDPGCMFIIRAFCAFSSKNLKHNISHGSFIKQNNTSPQNDDGLGGSLY